MKKNVCNFSIAFAALVFASLPAYASLKATDMDLRFSGQLLNSGQPNTFKWQLATAALPSEIPGDSNFSLKIKLEAGHKFFCSAGVGAFIVTDIDERPMGSQNSCTDNEVTLTSQSRIPAGAYIRLRAVSEATDSSLKAYGATATFTLTDSSTALAMAQSAATLIAERKIQDSINLGTNDIIVCNDGLYSGRAVISYTVINNRDGSSTAGTKYVSSFPVAQCKSVSLPAGPIAMKIDLRRYVGQLNSNSWSFGDVQRAAGDNDRSLASYEGGAEHLRGKFSMGGATCNPTDSWESYPASVNATISRVGDAEVCKGDVSTSDIGVAVLKTGADIFFKILFGIMR